MISDSLTMPSATTLTRQLSSNRSSKIHVAGHIRNADRVAVRADAVDDAARDVALMRIRIFDAPEAQRIRHGNHFGAHA